MAEACPKGRPDSSGARSCIVGHQIGPRFPRDKLPPTASIANFGDLASAEFSNTTGGLDASPQPVGGRHPVLMTARIVGRVPTGDDDVNDF